MPETERAILREVIYDRVRAAVNLCQLVIVEQDLEQSIERALERRRDDADEARERCEGGPGDPGTAWTEGGERGAGGGGPGVYQAHDGDDPAALARGYIEDAWRRLATEWAELRERHGG